MSPIQQLSSPTGMALAAKRSLRTVARKVLPGPGGIKPTILWGDHEIKWMIYTLTCVYIYMYILYIYILLLYNIYIIYNNQQSDIWVSKNMVPPNPLVSHHVPCSSLFPCSLIFRQSHNRDTTVWPVSATNTALILFSCHSRLSQLCFRVHGKETAGKPGFVWRYSATKSNIIQ